MQSISHVWEIHNFFWTSINVQIRNDTIIVLWYYYGSALHSFALCIIVYLWQLQTSVQPFIVLALSEILANGLPTHYALQQDSQAIIGSGIAVGTGLVHRLPQWKIELYNTCFIHGGFSLLQLHCGSRESFRHTYLVQYSMLTNYCRLCIAQRSTVSPRAQLLHLRINELVFVNDMPIFQ